MLYIPYLEPLMIALVATTFVGMFLNSLALRQEDHMDEFSINPVRGGFRAILRGSKRLNGTPYEARLDAAIRATRLVYALLFVCFIALIALIASQVHWYRVPGDPTT